MDRERSWCRVHVVDADGVVLIEVTVRGPGTPDLEAVDLVGRLALGARREGWAVELDGSVRELRELLELAALPVEVRGQAEGLEQPRRLEEREEEAHLGDAP